jgi:hypothetical protein
MADMAHRAIALVLALAALFGAACQSPPRPPPTPRPAPADTAVDDDRELGRVADDKVMAEARPYVDAALPVAEAAPLDEDRAAHFMTMAPTTSLPSTRSSS